MKIFEARKNLRITFVHYVQKEPCLHACGNFVALYKKIKDESFLQTYSHLQD